MQANLNPTLRPAISAKSVTAEHPLAYLPGSSISQYAKHETIYFQGEPATTVYLVMEGKVKILCHESRRAVVDVYRSDELFGESVLAGHAHRMEQAVAMEPTILMSWSHEEIEKSAASSPEFGTALIRFVVRRSLDFTNRIESFSTEKIERRLTRALMRFAGRFGSAAENGTVKMDALTHEFLAQYVGTSREIVSQYMNQFKRAGYLQYSRNGISLQQSALMAWQTERSTAASMQSAAQAN
jgi:CRP/FNR family cyclic AMP-dependent transcriptional regulator